MQGINESSEILKKYFSIHGSRLKFIAQMMQALIKVRTVNLHDVAGAFQGNNQIESNEKRIWRFLKFEKFELSDVSRFIASFLPKDRKWLLALDRTTWQIGSQVINILTLSVVHKGVSIPLMWTLLRKEDLETGKKGNSNCAERIELMERFIKLFDKELIEAVIADREFIGNIWLLWLESEGIPIHVRVRKDLYATDIRGHKRLIPYFFQGLKVGQTRRLRGKRHFGDVRVYLSGIRLSKEELLIVASFNKPKTALEIYAKRWQIETMFACLKSKGFNLEASRLKCLDKLSRLLALVSMAFVWAYIAGDVLNKEKPVPLKKHGYRARSIFRYGLDHLRQILFNMSERLDEFLYYLKLLDIDSQFVFVR